MKRRGAQGSDGKSAQTGEANVLSDEQVRERLEQIVVCLNRGELISSIDELKKLLTWGGEDAQVLFNLGLALNAVGNFSDAEKYLRRSIDLDPSLSNAYVGLSVSLSEQNKIDDAIDVLKRAEIQSPDNPYLLRNLGSILLDNGEIEEAQIRIEKAYKQLRSDQLCLLLMGKLFSVIFKSTQSDNDHRRSDLYLKETIQSNPDTREAEKARAILNEHAQTKMRKRGAGLPRLDAVMYIINYFKITDLYSEAQKKTFVLEIALIGSKGLSINDPSRIYKIASLPGTDFTGMHILSMMYAGMREQGLPYQEIGVDLSTEYEMALSMKN